MPDTASEAAVILGIEQVNIPFMPGQLPGSNAESDEENPFSGGWVRWPVSPKSLIKAVKTNGGLHAVCSAVADGCAGVRYSIVPRFSGSQVEEGFKADEPGTWTPEAKKQRIALQVLIQTGFRGQGAKSLRMGFREQEMDRTILGWGGIIVSREPIKGKSTSVPKPTFFSRFEACNAHWSSPDYRATMVPVPVALEDGTIFWVEEPRHFRRLKVQLANNHIRYYKEYGDWRAMDARTGKFSNGNRHVPSVTPGKPGTYNPGKLDKKAVQATEVMTWRTPLPGLYPYGWSGWHSELKSSEAANEHIDLVLSYLKSGLHSVILAAANRPFEAATAQEAVNKIDTLGRGREGLASLITLALVPSDSATSQPTMPFTDATADRGRLILHELTTRLPSELMQSEGLQKSLNLRFSEAERIPGILLGRSDNYNFATASAAWSVVNRLRFGPHHEEREAFLDRILIEMGITLWRIEIESPEWDESEPLTGITSASGQLGGVSVNQAMKVFTDTAGLEFNPVNEWWGSVPMPFVKAILESSDPAHTAALLKVELPPDALEKPITPGIVDAVDGLQGQIDDKAEPEDSDEFGKGKAPGVDKFVENQKKPLPDALKANQKKPLPDALKKNPKS